MKEPLRFYLKMSLRLLRERTNHIHYNSVFFVLVCVHISPKYCCLRQFTDAKLFAKLAAQRTVITFASANFTTGQKPSFLISMQNQENSSTLVHNDSAYASSCRFYQSPIEAAYYLCN